MIIEVGRHSYRVPFKVEADGDGFCGRCPDLPGLAVFGKTKDEARTFFEESARLYIESCLKHRDPIPTAFERQGRKTAERKAAPAVAGCFKEPRVAVG